MKRKKILFVDDEEFIRTSLAREIVLEGYDVDTAASGDKAVTMLQQDGYDLVLSDLVMPGVDGFGVLQKAKEIAAETCVIILTGHGDMDAALEALRLGADDFLLKPCSTDELIFRIDRSLEKQTLLRQLAEQNLTLKEAAWQQQQVEAALRHARDDLKRQVQERTVELEEKNIALRVLLKKREEDTVTLEQQIAANIADFIEPYLLKLKNSSLDDRQQVLVELLQSNFQELTLQFSGKLSAKLVRLTPAELQVANLVRQGKQSKEIAEIMHLAPGTISIYRKNIRKKLGLTREKVNLQSILSTYL